MPDKIGGDHMAVLITVPDLIHFLGNLDWWKDETSPNLEEVALRQLPKKYQNKSLKELQVRERTGCNVIGYKDAEGNQHINPDANHSLSVRGETHYSRHETEHKKIKQNLSVRLVCFSIPF